jgi:hypothetical protein
MKKNILLLAVLFAATLSGIKAQTHIWAVNSAGLEQVNTLTWTEDDPRNGVTSPYVVGASSTKNYSSYSGTNSTDAPNEMFRTFRYLSNPSNYFRYDVPIDNGLYVVTLYWSEIEYGYKDPGARQFNVLLENGYVLNNFDVSGEVGYQVSISKSFHVMVADGELNVEFEHGAAGNPFINGFKIETADNSIPVLTLDQPSVDFGEVMATRPAGPETLTLSNNSSTGISITNIIIDDPSNTFNIINNNPTSVSASGSTILGDATFIPSSSGDYEATITIEHSGVNSPSIIVLSGVGTQLLECGVLYENRAIALIDFDDLSSDQIPEKWEFSQDVDGYSQDGFLRWTGGDYTGSGGRAGNIHIPVEITNPGRYMIKIRSWQPGPDRTLENDIWISASETLRLRNNVDGSYHADSYPAGTWLKAFQGTLDDWTWVSNNEHDRDFWTITADFLTPGRHTVSISARSKGFCIDRLIIYRDRDFGGYSLPHGGEKNDALLQDAQTSLYYSCTEEGNRPTITELADQTVDALTEFGPLAFIVNDIENPTNLIVSATSSNQDVLPNTNITIEGDVNNKTIKGTPLIAGESIITVRVTDPDNQSASETFKVIAEEACPPESTVELYYPDLDGDGFGDASALAVETCVQPTGFVLNNTDCDDSDASINPDLIWYVDSDGDGAGSDIVTLTQCTQPEGYVNNMDDCNDGDPLQIVLQDWYQDSDGDGIGNELQVIQSCSQPEGYVSGYGDCNDDDPELTELLTYYADSDGDGFGDPDTFIENCGILEGYVENDSDCDDSNSAINPDAEDIADNDIDENCDGFDATTGPKVVALMLIDPENDVELFTINDGDRINMSNLTNNQFNLVAITNTTEGVGSASIILSGPVSVNKTEGLAPYAAFGDNGAGDYRSMTALEGSYNVVSAAYSGGGRSGEVYPGIDINFEFYVSEEPVIRWLTATDMTLSDALSPQNVVFTFEILSSTIFNSAVFHLKYPAGNIADVPINNISGNKSTMSVQMGGIGLYEIWVTINDAEFGEINSEIVNVEIVGNLTPEVDLYADSYELILDGVDVCTKATFTIIDELTIIEDNITFTSENAGPLTYLENLGSIEYCFTEVGLYPITIDVVDNAGNPGTKTIEINVIPLPNDPRVVSLTLIDAGADIPIPAFDPIPNGSILDLSTLPVNLNIVANVDQGELINSLEFRLNDRSVRTENAAPYAYKGDNGQGDFYNWNPIPGEYQIEAIPYSERSRGGVAYISHVVNFTIVDNAASVSNARTSGGSGIESLTTTEDLIRESYVNIYPNPTDYDFNVNLISYKTDVSNIRIFDGSGRLVMQKILDNNYNNSVDVSHLINGMYHVQVQLIDDVVVKKLLIQR